MADRPILFSAPMISALLAGRKMQTRRILKPQPIGHVYRYGWSRDDGATWSTEKNVGRIPIWAGDRLWVRETFSGDWQFNSLPPVEWGKNSPIWYWADGNPDIGDWTKPKPGIHMPRWASRMTLIVEDVKVERLQDISEEDAIVEGVPTDDDYAGSFTTEYCRNCGGSGVHAAFGAGYGVTEVDCAECETARLRYRNLWDHINGAGSWQSNPWVAAYGFSVIKQNIDQIGGVG